MITTYDFALFAQRDTELMQAINDAMASPNNEVVYTEIHKLSFFPSKQTVIVDALSKNSPFHNKIIPKEIKYSAINKMLHKNWESIGKDEIMDIE